MMIATHVFLNNVKFLLKTVVQNYIQRLDRDYDIKENAIIRKILRKNELKKIKILKKIEYLNT